MMVLFSFLLLTILSRTYVVSSRGFLRSKTYFKNAAEQFAYPIGVCYPRSFASTVTSVKLVCVEECTPPNAAGERECDRSVRSLHYKTTDCSGSIEYTDNFRPIDRAGEYPYNCYEPEELEGEEINPEEYAQSYMILGISRGKMITQTNDAGEEEEVCVKDESSQFLKTFPAITNLCVKGYEGHGANKRWYWYHAACNEDAAYLERWDQFNCTGNQTGIYPLYKPNGCDQRTIGQRHWYTQVINCTHPDYTIGEGFRNCNNIIIAIVFIFIVTLCN